MVDLPDWTPETAIAQVPQQRISGAGVAQGGEDLARGLEQAGAGLEDLATPIAAQEGREAAAQTAVTRNPDGSLNVATPRSSFILGDAGAAYADAAVAGTVAKLHAKIDTDMAGLATQYRGNPSGFQTAAQNYLQDLQSRADPVSMHAAEYGDDVAAQHYAGILDTVSRIDVATSKTALEGRQSYLENAMNGLAAQGGMNTPQYAQFAKERASIIQQREANPLFEYTKDMAAVDDDTFHNGLVASAAVGTARRMYQQTGNLSAAIDSLHQQISGLPLDETQKLHLEGEVTEHLRALDAVNQQQKQDLRDSASAYSSVTYATGKSDDTQATNLIGQLTKYRLYAAAADVAAAQLYARTAPAISNGTAAGAVAALESARQLVQSKINATASGFDAAADRTLGFEGSALVTDANGAAVKYGVNAAYNPGIDVSNLTPEEARAIYKTNYWDAIGADKLPPVIQGAAFDTAILAGPDRAKDMLKEAGGDPEKFMDLRDQYLNSLVAANPAKYGRYAQTWAERDEALRSDIEARQGSIDPAMANYFKAVNTLFNAHAQREYDGISDAFQKGFMPTADEVSDMRVLSAHVTDQGLRQKIETAYQAATASDAFQKLPAAQRNDMLQTLTTLGQNGGLDANGRAIVGTLGTVAQHLNTMARNDPVGYAHRIIPQSVAKSLPDTGGNVTDPAQLPKVMQANRVWRATAQKLDPTASLSSSVLTPLQRDQLTAALPSMNGQQTVGVLTALAGAKPDELDAELGQKSMSSAIIGLTRSGDYQKMNAAYSLMDMYYKRNPAMFDKAFGQDGLKNLMTWQSLSSFLPPQEVAKRVMTANDPATVAAQNNLRDIATKGLNGGDSPQARAAGIGRIDARGVLHLLGAGDVGAQFPAKAAEVVRQEYTGLYADMYAQTGDKNAANQYALERLRQKYSVSHVDGALMAYAPDRDGPNGGVYYPKINGSFDWLNDDLDKTVKGIAGPMAPSKPHNEAAELGVVSPATAAQQKAYNEYFGQRFIVSDDTTAREVASGRPPSYQIAVRDANGNRTVLTDPASGQPYRWRPDPKPYQAKFATDAAIEREAARERDKQVPLGEGITPGSWMLH